MLLQIVPTASCLYLEIINMGQLFTFLEQISISLFMEGVKYACFGPDKDRNSCFIHIRCPSGWTQMYMPENGGKKVKEKALSDGEPAQDVSEAVIKKYDWCCYPAFQLQPSKYLEFKYTSSWANFV